MKIRTACLVCLFAFAAVPAHAQDLEARVTALENQVAKLNGQITADDLVGTYTLSQFLTELEGTGGTFARITTGVLAGTVTLAADGTGTFSLTDREHTLVESNSMWSFTSSDQSDQGAFSWTYANGMVMLNVGNGVNLSAAVGGRVLIAMSSSNPDMNGGNNQLVILTRLR